MKELARTMWLGRIYPDCVIALSEMDNMQFPVLCLLACSSIEDPVILAFVSLGEGWCQKMDAIAGYLSSKINDFMFG